MEIEEKLKVLKSLDTKALIERLQQYEDGFQKAMEEETDFKAKNCGYLGSGDCQEVKRILAELAVLGPPAVEGEPAKKLTIADKETWLIKQRVDNKELNDAITKQRQVNFLISDHEIKVEMAKRRLAGITAVLSLKTQQIAFLAGN